MPRRRLGNLLIVLGVLLPFVIWLSWRMGTGGDNEALCLEESPTLVNPVSGVELLVQGFNPPADDGSIVATAAPTPGTPRTTPTPQPTKEVVKGLPPATRLVIPVLRLDVPVVEVPITNKTWDLRKVLHEVGHMAGTANPGETGNAVFAAHVTLKTGAGPFYHLEELDPGNLITVYAGEEAYTYRVVEKKYVEPTDVAVAYPTSEPILTMITCTSWDSASRKYTERIAVIAELVEVGP